MRLSSLEIDILRALAKNPRKGLALSSTHRVRLELLGLTRETPSGVVLTQLGERAQHLRPSTTQETLEPPQRRLDVMGRKLFSDRSGGRIG